MTSQKSKMGLKSCFFSSRFLSSDRPRASLNRLLTERALPSSDKDVSHQRNTPTRTAAAAGTAAEKDQIGRVRDGRDPFASQVGSCRMRRDGKDACCLALPRSSTTPGQLRHRRSQRAMTTESTGDITCTAKTDMAPQNC